MRFCVRAVAGLMALALVLPAVIGQPPGAGAGPPGPGAEPGGPGEPITARPAKPLAVKVFKLERGDPEAVVLALGSLLEDQDAEMNPPAALPWGVGNPVPPGVAPAGPMALPPGGVPGGFGGAPAGFGGGLPLPGGMLGVGGMAPRGAGVIGCFIGSGGAATTPVWRATTQPRTRAVIVRGSDRHLSVAADLVAILDRPAAAPLPKLQVVKAFALKHASAEELAEVIGALSFGDLRMATLDGEVLALVAPDDAAKAVAELVKELDVPGKGDPEPKKKPEPKAVNPPKE